MRTRFRISHALLLLGLAATAVAVSVGATAGAPGPAPPPPPPGPGPGHGQALYVSNTAPSGAPGPAHPGPGGPPGPPGPDQKGCDSAQYMTIGAAIAAASAGDTVVVCPGVYAEDVVVPAGKPLTLDGVGDPIVDASGFDNGIQVLASGSTVDGFTVGYATGEGILVGPRIGAGGTFLDGAATLDHVTIDDNTVIGNDRGNPTGAPLPQPPDAGSSDYVQCDANPKTNDPGDCGEGIHLMSVEDSAVTNNTVTSNSGGILLTDENGPDDGNTIASNNVSDNALDCGITVAGHHVGTPLGGGNFSAVPPAVGGVYDNSIRGNQADENGILGQGAGILLATGVPGGAVYDNTIQNNTATGNGLAGVTVHGHSGGENLNGNVVVHNTLGTNDIDGDPDFGGNTPRRSTATRPA
jgi:parallel beta-helix repeat protein